MCKDNYFFAQIKIICAIFSYPYTFYSGFSHIIVRLHCVLIQKTFDALLRSLLELLIMYLDGRQLAERGKYVVELLSVLLHNALQVL